jgi:predicted CXXCH cytochrome family protein
MQRNALIISALLCMACVFSAAPVGAKTGIRNTKHDLSSMNVNPDVIKSTNEDRICVFCHTPHNAYPQSPLWNKSVDPGHYAAYPPGYTSSTMASPPLIGGPNGPSRLCLSCHDGTIALEAVRVSREGGIQMNANGSFVRGRSNFGASLASHHPVSISYSSAAANPEINPLPPTDVLLFYNIDNIECSTCHDPHDNSNKKFLAVSNENSAMCVLCHMVGGWSASSHSTSMDTWNGLSENPWPRTGTGFIGYSDKWDFGWTTVKQNGCENCHAPHSAPGIQRLLNSAAEERNCSPCHNGNVNDSGLPIKNIMSQFESNNAAHRSHRRPLDAGYPGSHDPKETLPIYAANTHAECVDCHNPHAANNRSATAPGRVSGKLENVSGVQADGHTRTPSAAQYEYEVCFKCHADSSAMDPFINRVASTTRANIEFDTLNMSYHPVIDKGRHYNFGDVPSLDTSSTDPEAPSGLTSASVITCTDCHSDDVGGSRGPHGSQYAPILRKQYLTTRGTIESSESYRLCYRCHNRASILGDNSFRKNGAGFGGHSGHLTSTGLSGTAVEAPCSVCHDAHGIQDNNALINFDITAGVNVRTPPAPLFTSSPGHHGSCTLVCHDALGNEVAHDGSAKYTY